MNYLPTYWRFDAGFSREGDFTGDDVCAAYFIRFSLLRRDTILYAAAPRAPNAALLIMLIAITTPTAFDRRWMLARPYIWSYRGRRLSWAFVDVCISSTNAVLHAVSL